MDEIEKLDRLALECEQVVILYNNAARTGLEFAGWQLTWIKLGESIIHERMAVSLALLLDGID